MSNNATTNFISFTLPTDLAYAGIAKGDDGKLYCAPRNASDVLVFDPAAGTTSTLSPLPDGVSDNAKFISIAKGDDGKLYCAPYMESDVLVIDPAAGLVFGAAYVLSTIDSGMGSGGNKFIGIAKGDNDKLYCAPFHASVVLVIDTTTSPATLSTLSPLPDGVSGTHKFAGIAKGDDGKLYCAPFSASVVLVIDPATGTTSTLSPLPSGVSGTHKFRGIAKGDDGRLYCAPFHASVVLVIDTTTSPTTLSTLSPLPDGVSGNAKFIGIAKGDDGKLYCAPFNINKILYITTPTTTISPICFAKGTIISTDQGNVEIQNIIPGKHTICKKAICHITKTISPEKKIVCVKKNAFGKNKPNKAITMSGNHCIQPKKGSLVKAKDLVLSNPKMKFVDYNQEPLYNVLMEDHNVIKVQNLEVETLHPENIVAKIHNSLMDKSILAKLVKQMNEGIQENNREKYLIAEYEIKKIN